MVFARRSNVAGELIVPPAVQGAADAKELVRFWIAGGKAHLSLSTVNSANLPAGDEGVLWGVILADIARHSANAMQQSGATSLDKDALMTQITQTFLNELGYGRDMSGSILDGET